MEYRVMPLQSDVQQEIDQYIARLEWLYRNVEAWIAEREPNARAHRTTVELAEEATGPYKAESLEIIRPGKPAVRLIPKGIFMVGAHGRVDVWSRLGREIVVWLDKGEPHLHVKSSEETGTLEQIVSPLYPVSQEGWAWADERQRAPRYLTEPVFVDELLDRLTT
ncbi:MAG: hypothetical protein HY718_14545 [Planctomycetes bacterium]|nr:hypothetical protein [Planctomycetota bacterium]